MLWKEIERLERDLNPWREFERMQKHLRQLQKEIDRIFSNGEFPVSGEYPPINIWTNGEGAIVTAELPGVSPEDVEITVVGKRLTIQGRRKADEVQEGVRYHFKERWDGEFTRNVELPFNINADAVEAKFTKGILVINLPRAEEDKPRKIAVESA